jgi:DNA invertase Pin-like site-specific DNA recombinase
VRAVGYFRERKGDKSLAEQNKAFLEFCQSNGYEAAAVFLDASPTPDDVPGFRQMVEFLRSQRQRGFLLVAVPDLGGLGDNLTESARRYFQLSSLGVGVVAMDGSDDLGDELLKLWAAARKNGRLGDRVRAAMRKKAVKGEALGRPPYGYRVGPRGRLQVVPEEGSVVRYIFRLYLKDGLGIRRIARRLNEEEIRTRRGWLWSMVTVRDLLRNRAYLGTYSRFGVRVPASHPPLISPEDFRRVQERQSWRRRSDGEVRSALYRYYQCGSRTNRSLCDYHTRRAEALEEEVRRALLDSPAQASTAAAEEVEEPPIEEQGKQLRDRMRRLDRQLEQFLDAATSGRLNGERLRSRGVEVAGQRLTTEETLAERQRWAQMRATEAQRRQHQRDALARCREQWDELAFPERHELLRQLLERVVVRDEGIQASLRP